MLPERRASVFDFTKLTGFNLARGSHDQPNGDICVTEAAIIAAGLEYRAIKSAKDCPPCFSHIITEYAIGLNDRIPDDLRNELLKPFVPRLAGTSDTDEIEQRRLEYIVLETVRKINAHVCRYAMTREDFAERCESVRTIKDIRALMTMVVRVTPPPGIGLAESSIWSDALCAAKRAADFSHGAFPATAASVAKAAARACEPRKIFTLATEILDGAIRLGRHVYSQHVVA
jgi:hypothetical protein